MVPNRLATHKTFSWGKSRSWIEGTFRGYKSQGFDLQELVYFILIGSLSHC